MMNNKHLKAEKHKSRNSSFELLRIISMFLIVLHHYAIHGTLNVQSFQSSRVGTFMVNAFLQIGGKVGVVIFVLIGATFLCEKKFEFRRPIYLLLLSWIYSTLIFLVLEYMHEGVPKSFSITNLLLPIPIPSGYWFVGSYVLMLFMMPLLNLVLKSFGEYKIIYILIFFFLMWSVLASLLDIFPKLDYTADDTGEGYGTYFLFMYLIAGYLRIYGKKWMHNFKITFSMLIVVLAIDYFVISLLCNQNNWIKLQVLLNLQSPLVLFTSISIFFVFKSIKIRSSKFINYVATSMFAVYLIHDNSFLRPLIWAHVNANQYDGLSYLLHGFSSTLVIFLICTGIDIVGRLLYNKPLKIISKRLGDFGGLKVSTQHFFKENKRER